MNSSYALHYNGKEKIENTKIVKILSFTEGKVVCTDKSPFHPEDYLGGDQPGDKGILKVNGQEYVVTDTHTIIYDNEMNKIIYPESKGVMYKMLASERISLLVGHYINDLELNNGINFTVNDICSLRIDSTYRNQLSKPHTMVHCMALILNQHLNSYWKKENNPKDGFDNFNFDMMAIQSSKISANSATDIYRIGKSLRKKDFDVIAFEALDFSLLSKEMTNDLNTLINSNKNSIINMEGESLKLGTKRFFNTILNEKEIRIPCGGTHLYSIGDLPTASLNVDYDLTEKLLRVHTKLIFD